MFLVRFIPCVSMIGILLTASNASAQWCRDFDDGTFQGLIEWDPNEIFGGIDEFTPHIVDQAMRMDFNAAGSIGNPGDDSAIMYDPTVFSDTSVKMLIRWSTNPIFASTDDDAEMNAGILLRMDVENLRSYLLTINDAGYLQMYKTDGLSVTDVCPGGFLADVEPYDVTTNHWLRFECRDNGAGGLVLRGRSWPEGTEEPCTWQVFCVDTINPYPPGVVGVLANEDPPLGDGEFVDLDDICASGELACTLPESACSNSEDDDGDGLIDCVDPDCALTPACNQCPAVFADADEDGDVDQTDFAALQRCLSVADAMRSALPTGCTCFDHHPLGGDGDIDQDDVLAFERCRSGPMIPADADCGNP